MIRARSIAVLTAAVLAACAPSVEDQARKLGDRPFSAPAWAAAGQEERGAMVASLLQQHKLQGKTPAEVRALLGEPTGYYNYDENAAYVVGPTTVKSTYARGYLLVFVVDKTTSRVEEVRFEPNVR